MFRWYVVNTYSGHENKVKANLEHRIESMGQRPRFRRVVVPTEQVIETKDGQKVQAEKRVLPGYGESDKVTSGPLSDFDGEIVDVNPDAQKLKVLVDIFERQVPVELGFDQVKKLD
jgi:transcription antitermination factor NusG